MVRQIRRIHDAAQFRRQELRKRPAELGRALIDTVDIRTVAQLMGHRTIQMTMQYAHLAPDHNQSAVDRLASFSREVVATKSATRVSTPSQRA
jgi:integrase